MDDIIGSLEVGKKADMIILNGNDIHSLPMHNPIGNIVYSKVIFKKGSSEVIPGSEMIYDITPLYMLNSITNTIECSSSEKAVKAVKALFED